MKLPTTGWPADVLDDLAQYISETIEQETVDTFYIGRSGSLDSATSRHGCDEIVPHYETDSVQNAIELEGSLIEQFLVHEKCDNKTAHGGGGVSLEFVSYGYLALWYC
jgi:hypothetical protein